MKKSLLSAFLLLGLINFTFANPGDTTVVQTFTFADGRQSRQNTFAFPDGSKTYSKVLMYYTLKCDNTQNPACGEWDYDVFTDVLKPIGVDETNEPIYDVWRIGAYITPYGIGLDMSTGWTWIYDATDFLPILKNNVILRDNNGQELLDLKFVFIEGEPVRDVVDIKKVWSSEGYSVSGYWQGYPICQFDDIVKDTTFALNANEKQVKLRTTVTGHDFGTGNNCGEFCKNIQKVRAGGQVVKQWNIIQSCSDNPLYPQGGTWIYDRAGWCPGMEAKTNEFELTPYIQGSSITFDYDVTSDPYGVYRAYIYLVTYGDIKHADDAEATLIITPTDNKLQTRFNPSCFGPRVVIKNLGSNPLKSAQIHYGFVGASEFYTYSWNGNAGFLQTDTITLPAVDWNKVETGKATFYFEVLNPNGVTDPTPYNNRLTAVCSKPVVFGYNDLIFDFKTNKKPKETTWQLTNIYGEVLYKNEDNMSASILYTTEMSLQDGSYRLYIYDTGNNGLSFWANSADGSGSAILNVIDTITGQFKALYRFNGDFGKFIQLEFAINKFSKSDQNITSQSSGKDIYCYPNPAKNEINIDLLHLKKDNFVAEICDFTGKKLFERPVEGGFYNAISIEFLTDGIYFISIKSDKKQMGRGKFIVAK